MFSAPSHITLDCFIDVVAAGSRAGAPIMAVAALFFDPTGREEIPELDPRTVAAQIPRGGSPNAFFACIADESNAGVDLRPTMSENLYWRDVNRDELAEGIRGPRAPAPMALRDMFQYLEFWIRNAPDNARPVRFWMNRPERDSLAINEAFRRHRGITEPWNPLSEFHSLHTLNRLAYGRGREINNTRPLLDPFHPLTACEQGARQVQQAFQDLAEYGPAEFVR